MLNFLALGVIAFSILLAIYGLWRESTGRPLVFDLPFGRKTVTPDDLARPGVLVSLNESAPATLSGFDPRAEALLVQMPAEEAGDMLDTRAFSARPGPHGSGQDILFGNRVLVHLPDVPPNRHVDLYVEALPA